MASHRILLTGANGYIASNILSQLLSSPANHSVRAVVRSSSKVEDVKAVFPNATPKQLDFAIVQDVTVPKAFDEVLKSDPPFDTVMHTASPFSFRNASSADDILKPAIDGTIEVLAGIQRVASSTVTRVILTSSVAAVGAWGLAADSNKIYTEDDWFPGTRALVEENKDNMGFVYIASKTFAERAAWKAQRAPDVKWDLVTLIPPLVVGPLVHKVKRMEDLNETMAFMWNGFLREEHPDGEIPPLPFGVPIYVDVRDIAKAHVLAMDVLEAANQRFIVTAGLADCQKMADIMRAEVPGAEKRVPKGTPGKNTFPEGQWSASNEKVKKVLGPEFRSVEETFGDLGRQLLQLEKAL